MTTSDELGIMRLPVRFKFDSCLCNDPTI